MENRILIELQQNPVSTTVPLGAPNWSGITNPQFNQGVVDFCINSGYTKVMSLVARLEMFQTTVTIPVVPNQFYYTFNPPTAGSPKVAKLKRVQYTPTGLNYTYEFSGQGTMDLVSWNEFLYTTGNLYGLQTGASSGTLPAIVSVVPGNKQIAIYPAGILATDTLTYIYAPLPTPGASTCPTLVAESDQIVLPGEYEEAIVQWALYILWSKARVFDMKQQAYQAFKNEMNDIYANNSQLHPGDVQGFRLDAIDDYVGMS